MTSRFMGDSIEVRPQKWLLGFIFLEELNRDAESEACHFSKLCWVDS